VSFNGLRFNDGLSQIFAYFSYSETFIESNYKAAFDAMVKKCKEPKQLQCRSKSTPMIPRSKSCKPPPKNSSSCNKVLSKEHVHCVSKDKYPCCDHNSSDEKESDMSDVCETPKKNRNCPVQQCEELEECRPPSRDCAEKRKKKKGFFASCCPCCVKRPISRPQCEEECRPVSRACGGKNIKMTQTSPEDFARAKKCLKAAMAEEKRRQKMYGKKKKSKGNNSCVEERERGCKIEKPRKSKESCEMSCQEKEKNEKAYEKAREKYRMKRKKMEKKISKALSKEKQRQKQKC
jgi:hypothetical protein